MIDVAIPGYGHLLLTDLVCDFNGTLARDGRLVDGVRALLGEAARLLTVRVVTGDTFGSARSELGDGPWQLTVLEAERQAEAKAALVERLGAERVVAIGNGRNDRLMLGAAALGIAVIGDEGIAADAGRAAHILTRHVGDAFALLLDTRRLIATLRG